MTPTRFRSQLEGLLKRGYKAWPLEKLIEHSEQGRPIPAKTFAVTFDDGYENVYSEAWPILQEFDIPATVFVATNYLDSQDPFPFDLWAASGSKGVPVESWRPLSTAQCHEMLDSGTIEIGTHTHTHHDFRNRPGAFREDMLASLDFLRERFGLSNPTFALPYGLWQPDHGGQTLNTIARDVGVRCCLTTVEEEVASGSNPYGWGRVEVTNSDTASTLIARMEGWYGAVRRAWKNTCRIVKWPLKRERSPLPLPAGLSQQSKPSYPTARS